MSINCTATTHSISLLRNVRLDTGLNDPKIRSMPCFLISGHNSASLKLSENSPFLSEVLTILVKGVSMASRCSLSNDIGNGSFSHDFVGALLIIVLNSSSSISLNSINLQSVCGELSSSDLSEAISSSVEQRLSMILLILVLKSSLKPLASSTSLLASGYCEG